MQLTTAAAVLAFSSSALAQILGFDTLTNPTKDEVLEAGTTYDVKWDPAPSIYDEETVSAFLMFGKDHQHLDVNTASPLASKVVNKQGGFAWAIDSGLGLDAAYGIKLVLDSNSTIFQFSNPFTIKASASAGNSTTKTTGTTTALTSGATTAPKITRTETVPAGNTVSTRLSTTTSPGAGAQATAGAFAVLGGIAMAALAL